MTFSDITPFDWSEMINDHQARKGQPDQLKQHQPLSPVSDNDNNNVHADDNAGNVWLEGFLSTEGAANSTASNVDNNNEHNSNESGSPLEFSTLFDVADNELSSSNEADSIFTSAVTSLDNSPIIKSEEKLQIIPELELTESSLTRNSSTSSINSDSNLNLNSNLKTQPKPKKKRAPRKRLTDHQKQAHNKIEKRYRININAKIAGLQQIIPWVASEKTAFETGENGAIKTEEETGDVPRLNKSMILEKATCYILFLQEKEVKLEAELQRMRDEVSRLGGSL